MRLVHDGRWLHRSVFTFFCLYFLAVPRQGAASGPARQWVLLIGVQKHDDATLNLNYTQNDVENLRQTLIERAGMPSDRILTIYDGSLADAPPTLANLRRQVIEFLARPKDQDQVLVFFSGHGVTVEDETYLVPSDFRRADAQGTGLKAAELREALNNCVAKVKFLVLDCCHAGGVKDPQTDVPAERLAKAVTLEPVHRCLVLASCRSGEKSWEWPARRSGVFTYWLCRALEGGADGNGDARLTFVEVHEYMQERVSRTVDQEFGGVQTPVRFYGDEEVGRAPEVLALQPEPPETLCRRLAEHLDLEIRHRQINRVGVLEFLQPLGRIEGLAASNLPAFCSDQVRQTLEGLANGEYTVVDEQRMESAAKNIGFDAIGDPEEMVALSRQTGGLDAVVTGTLRRRGTKMTVECELVDVKEGSSLISPSGRLPLSVDLVGDSGASFDNREQSEEDPYDTQTVGQAQSSQDHPALLQDDPKTEADEKFPFDVEIWSIDAGSDEEITDKTPRTKKAFVIRPPDRLAADNKRERTDLLIAAREGEVFEMRVRSRWPGRSAMALLVDGINSLGQKRERLEKSRFWVLKAGDGEVGREHLIKGWHIPQRAVNTREGTMHFTVKRFKFVRPAESVAARQSYGESIGLITAGFFAEAGRSDVPARLGVGEGPEHQEDLTTVKFRRGNLIGVLNIRYVHEDELDRLLSGETTLQ